MENQMNTDGFQNLFTLSGTTRDKMTQNVFKTSSKINDTNAIALYRQEGLAQRAVDILVSDMIRAGITIEEDIDGKILKSFNTKRYKTAFREALTWAYVFGGAVVVLGVDDGSVELSEPVNENKIKDVTFWKVYDRRDVIINTFENIDNDVKSSNYGNPLYYEVNNDFGTTKVHYSRVLHFHGIKLPRLEERLQNGWGDSILEALYNPICYLSECYKECARIVTELSLVGLKVNDLMSYLQTDDGMNLLYKRLELMDLSRHTHNTILLDNEEELNRYNAQLTGLNEVIKKIEQFAAATSGIPSPKLLGEQVAGLGTAETGLLRFYYDDVSFRQEDELLPHYQKICKYLAIAKGVKSELTITFNSLWQQTEKELADIKKVETETTAIDIQNNVLAPEEVRQSRYGTGVYSNKITIDKSMNLDPIEPQYTGDLDESEKI